ncbi:MAG: hypothetical protein AAGA35_03800 [Patescibacteria group bacterium]
MLALGVALASGHTTVAQELTFKQPDDREAFVTATMQYAGGWKMNGEKMVNVRAFAAARFNELKQAYANMGKDMPVDQDWFIKNFLITNNLQGHDLDGQVTQGEFFEKTSYALPGIHRSDFVPEEASAARTTQPQQSEIAAAPARTVVRTDEELKKQVAELAAAIKRLQGQRSSEVIDGSARNQISELNATVSALAQSQTASEVAWQQALIQLQAALAAGDDELSGKLAELEQLLATGLQEATNADGALQGKVDELIGRVDEVEESAKATPLLGFALSGLAIVLLVVFVWWKSRKDVTDVRRDIQDIHEELDTAHKNVDVLAGEIDEVDETVRDLEDRLGYTYKIVKIESGDERTLQPAEMREQEVDTVFRYSVEVGGTVATFKVAVTAGNKQKLFAIVGEGNFRPTIAKNFHKMLCDHIENHGLSNEQPDLQVVTSAAA